MQPAPLPPTPILEVRFYCTLAGHEPVRDFLKSLSKENRKEIGLDIKTVQFAYPIGMPLVRKLEKSLWEVRTELPDGIARVIFTVLGSQMILLHGFIKKSQKTPTKDLELARKRLRQLEEQ